jgi:hypothetical protein
VALLKGDFERATADAGRRAIEYLLQKLIEQGPWLAKMQEDKTFTVKKIITIEETGHISFLDEDNNFMAFTTRRNFSPWGWTDDAIDPSFCPIPYRRRGMG